MTTWVRLEHQGKIKFGTLSGTTITIFQGELFGNNFPGNETVELDQVKLMTPCMPGKILALWNNFHATSIKTGLPRPEHPWYFVKTPNTYAATNSIIRKPAICSGKILFEGELGIVIGKTCKNVATANVRDNIFGYTCVNDATAIEYLFNEETFAHWTRAKCFDGFGVFGPGIATDIDPQNLVVKTFLENGNEIQERQNYPVSDMIYSPSEIVSKLSFDMTLDPGDIISCGTSVGAGAMKEDWLVRVSIAGVGVLENTFTES